MGIWIISDEAYERLVFDTDPGSDGTRCAPSLLDFADPQDRVIVANTFSKAWQMTGWRLGWLVVPPALLDDLGKLIEARIGFEVMDLPAACRTFNILMTEGRLVAAALLIDPIQS